MGQLQRITVNLTARAAQARDELMAIDDVSATDAICAALVLAAVIRDLAGPQRRLRVLADDGTATVVYLP
jgi:hypothetical protein